MNDRAPDPTFDAVAAKDSGPDLPFGTVLAGRYRIDTLLGRGGMGTVYQARHVALDEDVVVKVMNPEWATKEVLRTRFRREATTLAKLRHPCVVTVHDFGEHEGALYIVMELLRGRTLASLAGDDPLRLSLVGVVFDGVLRALEATHAVGVVHRDVKPENVMVQDADSVSPIVKLLDFGLARVDEEGGDRLTKTGAFAGTPAYASPEQCRGLGVGTPTDVYAVGAMLYEVLSGDAPFRGDSPAEVIAQQLFAQPPPIAEGSLRRSVPGPLEDLVKRAMSKEPEIRPTAAGLRADLAAVLRGEDAGTFADRSASDRARLAALDRAERALPGVLLPTTFPPTPSPRPREPPARTGAGPAICLWGFDARRADRLRAALGVNGLASFTSTDAEPPQRTGDDRDFRAVLVSGTDGEARTARIRADAILRRVPVLVVDVAAQERTLALIRVGASDIALEGISDTEICSKVWRLVRRGR